MQLGMEQTGRRSLVGHYGFTVFCIVKLLTGCNGNALFQCLLLSSSVLTILYSLLLKARPSYVNNEKKCQGCKKEIPRSCIFPQPAGGISAELPLTYENKRCLFLILNKTSDFSKGHSTNHSCAFYPSKWFPSTPLTSSPFMP